MVLKTLLVIIFSALCTLRVSYTIPSTGCVGDTLVFKAVVLDGTSPYTYYWRGGDSDFYMSSSDAINKMVITSAHVFTVSCTVTDKNGCISNSVNNDLILKNCK